MKPFASSHMDTFVSFRQFFFLSPLFHPGSTPKTDSWVSVPNLASFFALLFVSLSSCYWQVARESYLQWVQEQEKARSKASRYLYLILCVSLISWPVLRIRFGIIFGKLDRDPHPHQSGKLEPDPHQSEKQDPNPHQSEKVIKSHTEVTKYQCFFHYFCLMIEGSWSVFLTNGSGSGTSKKIWIPQIRIRLRNTARNRTDNK